MHQLLKIRPALLATLFLLSAAAVAFFPALFQGRILAPLDITTTLLSPWEKGPGSPKPHNHSPSDAVTQYLPYRIHIEKSLREDGYIGWNPYEMGGCSLAGNTMALPGTWTMQLHRFLPFESAWDLGLLAEFLTAGLGMLVFLRSRGLPWLACVLGAIAYMGNSQFVIWVYHRWALGSFCWMPWILWSSANGLSWRNPTIRQLLLPFFLTLALLGGTLQHMVFVALACGCIAVGGMTDLKSTFRNWPTFTAWAAAFGIATAMAAFTLVPQILAYIGNIEMGHVRGGIGYAEGTSQPFLNLLAIPAQIWPWLLGDPQTIDAWRLLKSNIMNLAYLGTIPMVLAFAGLFHRNMPRQAKWLIVVGLIIPITPLVGPLYHRVQLLFLLGGSWMAAEMVARLAADRSKQLVRGTAVLVIALGAGLLVGTVIPSKARTAIEDVVVAKSLDASAGSNFGDDPAWITSRAHRWTDRFSLAETRTGWIYALLVMGTAGLALSNRPRPAWGNLAILGATSLELFTFFQTWTTFSDPKNLTPPHPAIEKVRELAGNARVMQGLGKTSLGDSFAAPNLLSAYLIPSVDAYESIQAVSTTHKLRKEELQARLTLAGVGIAVQRSATAPFDGTDSWPVVDATAGFSIRRNPNILPPVLAGSDAIPGDPDKLLPSLLSASRVEVDESTMNHWTFNWPPEARWIRISQNWHAGWQWKTGSSGWNPVLRGGDDACWILQDHPVSGKIEVRFFPRPHALGPFSFAVFLISALCALVIFIRLRNRTESQNAELPLH